MNRIGYGLPVCIPFLFTMPVVHAAKVETREIATLAALALSDDFTKCAVVETEAGAFEIPKSLKLMDRATKKLLKSIPSDRSWGTFKSATFSPDGRYLAILAGFIGDATTGKIIDLQTGELVLNVRQPTLTHVVFNANATTLASSGGGFKNTPKDNLWLWNLSTNKKTVVEVSSRPETFAFSGDGKHLVAAHAHEEPADVVVYRLVKWGPIAEFKGHDATVTCVAWSPDGKTVASGSRDATIKLWDVRAKKEVGILDGHLDDIFAVAFHPRKRILASAGKDKSIRIWDTATKRLLHKAPIETHYVSSLTFSPDGQMLAIKMYGKIALWQIEFKESEQGQ